MITGSRHAGFDLAAGRFFERFGLAPGAVPSPENLESVYRAFCHLPYENVSKLVSAAQHGGIHLHSPAEVLEGYLENRLGGTCFSLTQCLYELLRHCGFQARRVLGDMRHGRNIHCAVVAVSGGREFLCDAGYLLPSPVELPSGVPSSLRGEVYTYHVSRDSADTRIFHLHTRVVSGESRWRYLIRNVPVGDREFETHWRRTFSAAMMNQLVLTRASEDGHLYLHNHKLRLTGPRTKKNSNLRGSVDLAVEELFGIDRSLVEEALAGIEAAKRSGGRDR